MIELVDELFWRFFTRYIPEFFKPNFFTLARLIVFGPLTLYLTIAQRYSLAFLFFALGGLMDAIDGNLARKRNLITRSGKILDPIADKILILSAAILALRYLSLWLLILYFLGEIGVILINLLLLVKKKEKGANIIGKITVLFLAASIVPWLYLFPKTPVLLLFLNFCLLIGIILRWWSLSNYIARVKFT